MFSRFLAALAYHTQKSLRDAPIEFGELRTVNGARTPPELVRHMASVLGYARSFFVGGEYAALLLATLAEEVERFHEMLHDLNEVLVNGDMPTGMTARRLLQRPFADT